MQLVIAAFTASALLLLFVAQIRPAIWQAIENLPEGAAISGGRLQWPGEAQASLAASDTLSISVSTAQAAEVTLSDFQVTFRETEARVNSFLGYWTIPYLRGYTVDLSRSSVEPLYGAWEAVGFVALGCVMVVALLASWHSLGAVYGAALGLLRWAFGKPLPYSLAYKVGLGSLVPGAILMFAGIFGYAIGQLSLPRLGIIWALHLILGWGYLLLATPLISRQTAGNPFNPVARQSARRRKSPFAGEPDEEPRNPFHGKKQKTLSREG